MIKEKDGKKNFYIGILVVSFILVGGAIFLITILNYGGEKNVSVERVSSEGKALVCDSGPSEEAFFSIENASQIKHQVKVLFSENRATKFFYMYSGKLKNESTAEMGSTDMHIKYDEYLGVKKSEIPDGLSATFNHPGAEVRIDIFTDVRGINPATATFFFLNESNLSNLMKKDSDGLKKYYEEKGFSCKFE